MKLNELLIGLEYRLTSGSLDIEITGLTNDSREVRPGSLFFCVPGTKLDGHDFAQEAIINGAAALVIENEAVTIAGVAVIVVADARTAQGKMAEMFYGTGHKKIKIVGVTGTNGKTTTTYIIESILKAWGKKTGVIGTVEYRVGDESRPASRTTPDSLDLHKMIDEMDKASVEVIVMEVSSHALDLARVDEIRFDAVVFTNLSQDHLDYHEDLEDYFQAKAKLFTMHKGKPSKPVFCINIDDKFGQRLIQMLGGAEYKFGFTENANVIASDIKISHKGTEFTLRTEAGSGIIETNLCGSFNVSNNLAAASAALALGCPIHSVIDGASQRIEVPGRFEDIDCGQDFSVIVDYAHTPDGLQNLLTLAREIAGDNRIITVFGCGGDRDHGKRPKMGEVAARLSDYVIVTSDNPRSEDPIAIIEEIKKGLLPSNAEHEVEVDRKNAIKQALISAKARDLIIIAGKGHEAIQEFKGFSVPFDDRIICRQLLMELGLCKI